MTHSIHFRHYYDSLIRRTGDPDDLDLNFDETVEKTAFRNLSLLTASQMTCVFSRGEVSNSCNNVQRLFKVIYRDMVL